MTTTFVPQTAPGRGGTGFLGGEKPFEGSSSLSSDKLPASKSTPTLKRRSSPSREVDSLDCHTLQSSLKRVRLSISPGELRLQRDLGALTNMGWQLLNNGPTRAETFQSQPPSKPQHPPAHFTVDQNPRWYFRASSTFQDLEAELHLLDPLRLVLHLRRASAPLEVGRIWIQIPRMYPHRPPVVSRTENLWMEQVIVREAPPNGMGSPSDHAEAHGEAREALHLSLGDSSLPAGSSLPLSLHSSSSLGVKTVIYNEWSPVQGLGELLSFLLRSSLERSDSQRRQSPSPTTSGAAPAPSPPTTTSRAFLPPPSSDSIFFFEEHKMEDAHSFCNHRNPHHDFSSQQNPSNQTNNKFMATFAPNRFDVGYGKYHNPIEHHRTIASFGKADSSSNPQWPTATASDVFPNYASNPQQHEMPMEL